jgi:hypothetical protein
MRVHLAGQGGEDGKNTGPDTGSGRLFVAGAATVMRDILTANSLSSKI